MIDIEFSTSKGPRRIRSSTHGYAINVYVKYINKETGEAEGRWNPTLFFSTLGGVVKAASNMKLRECDATTFAELCEVVKEVRLDQKRLMSIVDGLLVP